MYGKTSDENTQQKEYEILVSVCGIPTGCLALTPGQSPGVLFLGTVRCLSECSRVFVVVYPDS